jgi:hypothetical protein
VLHGQAQPRAHTEFQRLKVQEIRARASPWPAASAPRQEGADLVRDRRLPGIRLADGFPAMGDDRAFAGTGQGWYDGDQ